MIQFILTLLVLLGLGSLDSGLGTSCRADNPITVTLSNRIWTLGFNESAAMTLSNVRVYGVLYPIGVTNTAVAGMLNTNGWAFGTGGGGSGGLSNATLLTLSRGDGSVLTNVAAPSITNGLQLAGSYVTSSITNGLASPSVTNGLQLAGAYVTASVTNGLAKPSITNGLQIAGAYVTASVTNGLQAAGAYVTSSITNGLALPSVTNGLQIAGAYVTASVTNGLALPSVTNGLQIAGVYMGSNSALQALSFNNGGALTNISGVISNDTYRGCQLIQNSSGTWVPVGELNFINLEATSGNVTNIYFTSPASTNGMITVLQGSSYTFALSNNCLVFSSPGESVLNGHYFFWTNYASAFATNTCTMYFRQCLGAVGLNMGGYGFGGMATCNATNSDYRCLNYENNGSVWARQINHNAGGSSFNLNTSNPDIPVGSSAGNSTTPIPRDWDMALQVTYYGTSSNLVWREARVGTTMNNLIWNPSLNYTNAKPLFFHGGVLEDYTTYRPVMMLRSIHWNTP